MTDLSFLISQLVSKGWPRDYSKVIAPCWYTFASDSACEESLEDPDYAPDLTGREGCLVINPKPARYSIYIPVRTSGHFGNGAVEVHDGQVHHADGFAGCVEIHCGPKLEWLLNDAHRLYLEWELKQFEEEKTLDQLEEELKQRLKSELLTTTLEGHK